MTKCWTIDGVHSGIIWSVEQIIMGIAIINDIRLTLFCTGGDTFIPLSFLDQILSADFFSKIAKLFLRWKLTSNGLFWNPAQLIVSYRICPLGALKMSIFLVFKRLDRQGYKMSKIAAKKWMFFKGNICIAFFWTS